MTDQFGATLRRYTLPDGNHIGALVALVFFGIMIGSIIHGVLVFDSALSKATGSSSASYHRSPRVS